MVSLPAPCAGPCWAGPAGSPAGGVWKPLRGDCEAAMGNSDGNNSVIYNGVINNGVTNGVSFFTNE